MHCELILPCLSSAVFHHHPFTFLPWMNRWWVWCADEMSLLIITLFTNPGNQTINTTVHSWVSRTGGHTLAHLPRLQSTLTGQTGQKPEVPRVQRHASETTRTCSPGEIAEIVFVFLCMLHEINHAFRPDGTPSVALQSRDCLAGETQKKEHYCFAVED